MLYKIKEVTYRGCQTTSGLRFFSPEMQTCIEDVNGKSAIIGYLEGQPCGALMCEIEGERIRQIYAVVNPEKLLWLSKQMA